jgi:hypothetical protein
MVVTRLAMRRMIADMRDARRTGGVAMAMLMMRVVV